MKQITIRRTLALLLWACVLVVIYSQLGLFSLNAAAQEPPTKLIAFIPSKQDAPQTRNDAYGVNENKTLEVPPPGVVDNDQFDKSLPYTVTLISNVSNGTVDLEEDGSFTYVPFSNFGGSDTFSYRLRVQGFSEPSRDTTVTVWVRTVDFRVDTDDIEKGECVRFSWVVKGDVNSVEFDREDDGKDAIRVNESGERRECPDSDSTYQFTVEWLYGGDNTTKDFDIEVEDTGNGGGGGGGGGSSGGSGGVTVPQPGSFIMVTPILITAQVFGVPVTPTPVGGLPAPTGVLGSVEVLPETGMEPAALATPAPSSIIRQPEVHLTTTQPHRELWLAFAGGLVLLLGSTFAALAFLARFLHRLP